MVLAGIGIHTGVRFSFELRPSNQRGVTLLVPADGNGGNIHLYEVCPAEYQVDRRTSKLATEFGVWTCPEHLFAALALARIDAVTIVLREEGEFPPAPDGSGGFLELIEEAGLLAIPGAQDANDLGWGFEKIVVESDGRGYIVSPAAEFSLKVRLVLPEGEASVGATAETLKKDDMLRHSIASARTWVREAELSSFNEVGLCRGVLQTPCQVLSHEQLVDTHVLAECARHKLYDLVGDLYLLGSMPAVSITVRNPNHRLNVALLHLLAELRNSTR